MIQDRTTTAWTATRRVGVAGCTTLPVVTQTSRGARLQTYVCPEPVKVYERAVTSTCAVMKGDVARGAANHNRLPNPIVKNLYSDSNDSDHVTVTVL